MRCITCGSITVFSQTTDVTDFGNCLVIIRNVPCYKCVECSEIIYTADVIKRIEAIVASAKQTMSEVAIIDYNNLAA